MRVDSGVVRVDERLTGRAQEYWRRAEVPSGASRTVLVAGEIAEHSRVGELDQALGACVVGLPHPQSTGRRRDVIGSSTGRCLTCPRWRPA